MPMIPAFCEKCGTPFSSGIYVDSCANLTMSGNRSGPCPKCGGVGSVPDGIFSIFGNVIEVLQASASTVEQLRKYSQVLHQARKEQLTRDEVKSKIEKEVPELSSLSSLLPKTRTELYAFIALVIGFLTYTTSFQANNQPVIEQNLEVIINQSVQNILEYQSISVVQNQ